MTTPADSSQADDSGQERVVPGPDAPRGRDTTIEPDPDRDPAQREWESTGAADATATGDDPDQIPDPRDEIPSEDLPTAAEQPETQDASPEVAEIGETGQGDLGPGDL